MIHLPNTNFAMSPFIRTLFGLIFLFYFQNPCFGRSFECSSIDQDTLSGNINHYTPIIGFGCDSSTLLVSYNVGFSAGDHVMIIQMQGAEVDQSDSPAFGSILNTRGAGNYELNEISWTHGDSIQLKYKLRNAYTLSGKVQLVNIPVFSDAVIGQLTCLPWNGTVGGVLALEVQNKLTLSGHVDASGAGFSGALAEDADVSFFHELHYFYPYNPILAGRKGGGIAQIPANISFGRGNAANGGGGGNAHNAGGGGGGNGGAGGNGGLEFYQSPVFPTTGTNGIGGQAVSVNNPNTLLLGGGGGAGQVNDDAGASGGNGGGIVYIKAKTIIGAGGQIRANGADAFLPNVQYANDGQGGGGAGGSILLDAQQILGNVLCLASGGKGGNAISQIPDRFHGPGGGGGGGRLLHTGNGNGLVPVLNGGANGICNQNNPNDAAPGFDGIIFPNCVPVQASKIAQTQPTTTKYVHFCPGSTVIINGQLYTQPDTITGIIPATSGCDTLATYILTWDFQPTLNQTIEFCKGDTVVIDGEFYTTPQTVIRYISVFGACDTLVQVHLQYIAPSQPTQLKLPCSEPLAITIDPTATGTTVVYPTPIPSSNCPCPGIMLERIKGPESGSFFPTGITEVCFAAKDSCNNQQTCCFTVDVNDGQACDTKFNACMKYEILSVKTLPNNKRTYKLRVTNNCNTPMQYFAVEIPAGIKAQVPNTNGIYFAPGGHSYKVNNPNYSPMYGIRFSSLSDSIKNGQSDVFEYTLPVLANPQYIYVVARLFPQIYYEAHMNVFQCNVTFAPENYTAERQDDQENAILLFPNPTSGRLYTDLSAWNTESVLLRIYNIHGQLITQSTQVAETGPFPVELPSELPNGLYWLHVNAPNGTQAVLKFMLYRQ
ncbi:MAG: T9SS type A sorting domain-containing protein [Bacteroidetes bacterium]|nr:T9SS type A sorting domain-containing protein [Bacteroidota bacterium]